MYLLDTNIFRGLAAGDFPTEAAEIDRRLRSGIVLPFFTCEVVINEILVKLADDPVNRFNEVRSCFSWMERICGNSAKMVPNDSLWAAKMVPNDSLWATSNRFGLATDKRACRALSVSSLTIPSSKSRPARSKAVSCSGHRPS